MEPMDSSAREASPLSRGILVVTVAGLVAVLAILMVMLAYELYQHDIQTAEQNAERVSKLLTTAILSTMMKTGDKAHVRSLMAELKTKQDFAFRIYRGPNVERQYGVVEDERPNDEASRKVFELRRPLKVYPNDTTLRYLTPLITDQRCAQCHQDMAGNPVPPGVMQGAYEVVFDLKSVKSGSIRTIVQVMALTVGGLAVFAFLIYRLIASNILDPIRQMHYAVSGWQQGDYDRPLPAPHSRELRSLADLLRKIAQQRGGPGS
jgi:HAMP domain-containing protein